MDLKNFAIIRGDNATIHKGNITLSAKKNKTKSEIEPENKNELASIDIRSDVSFSNGTIELKFKSDNHKVGILLILDTNDEMGTTPGISAGISLTHDSFLIAEGTKRLSPTIKSGTFKNYELNTEHILKIEIAGSLAKLYMNNILLCESFANIKESPITLRISTEGVLEVYDIKATTIKPKIFVVMQFSKDYNDLYSDVIKPISEEAGFECVRADEFYTSTPILKDIIESLQSSAVIIAEITPDNPNVFYEIGYSHAIGKPTILLCDKKREKLPFDLSSFRTLFYENSISGKQKIENSLRKYLSSIK